MVWSPCFEPRGDNTEGKSRCKWSAECGVRCGESQARRHVTSTLGSSFGSLGYKSRIFVWAVCGAVYHIVCWYTMSTSSGILIQNNEENCKELDDFNLVE